jgi:hypothetical protein
LCEQVVGRGLRRSSYEVGDDGKLTEEVAKVFGVPFEIIPFKENKGGARPSVKRHHIHSLPEKAVFEIKYPRVEGYRQAIRNRVTIDWSAAPTLTIDPMKIPPEVEGERYFVPTVSARHLLEVLQPLGERCPRLRARQIDVHCWLEARRLVQACRFDRHHVRHRRKPRRDRRAAGSAEAAADFVTTVANHRVILELPFNQPKR